MAIRGENIGTAYIRILADGSGLDNSIRDSFKESDPAIEAAGRRHGDMYDEAFAKQKESRTSRDTLRRSLTDAIAKGDFLNDEFFNGAPWKEFRKSLGTRFGEAGDRAGQNLQRGLAEGMTFEGLEGRLQNLTGEIAKATREIQIEEQTAQREGQRKMLDDAYSMNKAFDRRSRKTLDEAYRLNSEHDRKRALQIRNTAAAYTDLTELIDRMNRGEEETKHSRAGLLTQLRDLRTDMDRFGLITAKVNDTLGDSERHLRQMSPELNRFKARINSTGEAVGKVFGKGSRNNFVNFLGSVAEGLVKTANIIPNVIGRVSGLARTFRFDGVAAGIGQVGTAMLGLGAVIGSLFVLVGPLLSIFSLLAGTVVALAGSIGFALIGAVGALGAALIPLAAGLGVVALAFVGMSDAQKAALKIKLKPLTDEFKSLAAVARENLFDNIGNQARRLAPVIGNLKPVVAAVAKAVSGVGDAWITAMRSPGFTGFLAQMKVALPNAITDLGVIFKNTFGGLGGVFLGMLPLLDRFLGWLVKITGEFNRWANSARGLTAITAFFKDAGDSARDFGGFLLSVVNLLDELLRAGKNTGDSLFRGMADSINGMTASLKANPDILHDWFRSSEQFAQSLGGIIIGIGRVFDALDSGPSRTAVVAIFDVLAASIKALGTVLEFAGPQISGFLVAAGGLLLIASRLGRAAAGIATLNVALRGLGASGAVAGAGATTAGEGGAAAAAGLGALGPILAAIVGGGLLAAFAVHIGDAHRTTGQFSQGLKDLAAGRPTAVFDNLTLGAKNLGDTLQRGAFSDFAGKFTQQIGQMDTALTRLPLPQAKRAFEEIARQGRAAGLTLGEVSALFPKYGARITSSLTAASRSIIDQQHNWFLLGSQMKSLPPQVQTAITTPGLIKTVDDVKTLKIMFDLTPRQVAITLAASGLAETIPQIKNLRREMNLTPKQIMTILRLNGQAETMNQVRRYGAALHLTPKQISTLLKATDGYSNVVHAGERAMTRFDRLKPTANLKANNKDAVEKANATAARLRTLDRQKINSQIKANNTQALAQAAHTTTRLNSLDRQRTNPTINANGAPALSVSGHVSQRLAAIAGTHPRPTISVNDNASGTIRGIQGAINSLQGKTVTIRTVHMDTRLGSPKTATGGMFGHAQLRWIGEAGPEAVVPLSRPLDQVDPAVRWLSAIAQGKAIPGMASGGTVNSGKTVDASGWQIITPGTDAHAVATDIVNQLAAKGY